MLSATDVRDATLLLALSVGLGLIHLGLRPQLPWIAEPQAQVCDAGVAPLPVVPLVERIDVERARTLHQQRDVVFVDARSSAAYEQGHVPGAVSLPASAAAGILAIQSVPVPVDALVVTYCDGVACEQSEYLGMLLQDRAGCEQVRVLEGGFSAWQRSGAPVAVGPEPGEGS